MRTETPQPIRLSDYRPPAFLVDEAHLTFVLEPNATRVKARLSVRRNGDHSDPLVFNGERLKPLSVAIDGRRLGDGEHTIDAEFLTVPGAPDEQGQVLILSLGSERRFTLDEISVLHAISPWVLALMRQRAALHEMDEEGLPLLTTGNGPYQTSGEAGRAAPVASAGAGAGNAAYATAQANEGLVIDESTATLARSGSSNLTNRELEIVHLLLSGFSSKGIAQKLKISPETVKGHRKHIYTKLGVKSHAELFAIYLQAKNGAR